MPYFSYHGRNKKLIKEGLLENYIYVDKDERYLLLIFKDGRQFRIKEERWMEYDKIIHKYYEGGIENEKNN